ncbi:hypothetical protein Tco_1541740 [Tanacetum coccineum]
MNTRRQNTIKSMLEVIYSIDDEVGKIERSGRRHGEPEDETVPASVHEVGESSTATFLREDGDRLLPGFMRMDIDSLFGRIASLSRRNERSSEITIDSCFKLMILSGDESVGIVFEERPNEAIDVWVNTPSSNHLNEAMRMTHKLMEQKLKVRNERILEGNKQKWENFQSGNSSGKSNHKDNSCQSLQNNQKQGNARAMTTTPN